MKKLFAFSTIMLLLLVAQPLSLMGETAWNHPCIMDPEFSINRSTVKLKFSYAGVAGHIRDARFTLAVSIKVDPKKDSLHAFHFVIGGRKGLFWSASDNRKITDGSITAFVDLPPYAGVHQDKDISGFGLALFDSRGEQSPPVFVDGDIVRETWFARWAKHLRKTILAYVVG